MKRDRLYLIISLAILLISGAVIYLVGSRQSPGFEHPEIPDERSQATVTLVKEIAQLKRQLEIDPDNFNTLAQLGNDYYDLNNPEESIKYYERALKVRPDSPEILVDCGVMYREMGQPDQAIELFRKASKLAPALPQASYNLGAVLFSEKKNPVAAADEWQRFLDNNPGISPEMKDFFEEKIMQARQLK